MRAKLRWLAIFLANSAACAHASQGGCASRAYPIFSCIDENQNRYILCVDDYGAERIVLLEQEKNMRSNAIRTSLTDGRSSVYSAQLEQTFLAEWKAKSGVVRLFVEQVRNPEPIGDNKVYNSATLWIGNKSNMSVRRCVPSSVVLSRSRHIVDKIIGTTDIWGKFSDSLSNDLEYNFSNDPWSILKRNR